VIVITGATGGLHGATVDALLERVPADGPVSWTAREDAAEAAAVVLASGGAYDGPVTMTVREALTAP
jgi:uncharacterized protein YbjT (DUF2867 family)